MEKHKLAVWAYTSSSRHGMKLKFGPAMSLVKGSRFIISNNWSAKPDQLSIWDIYACVDDIEGCGFDLIIFKFHINDHVSHKICLVFFLCHVVNF